MVWVGTLKTHLVPWAVISSTSPGCSEFYTPEHCLFFSSYSNCYIKRDINLSCPDFDDIKTNSFWVGWLVKLSRSFPSLLIIYHFISPLSSPCFICIEFALLLDKNIQLLLPTPNPGRPQLWGEKIRKKPDGCSAVTTFWAVPVRLQSN